MRRFEGLLIVVLLLAFAGGAYWLLQRMSEDQPPHYPAFTTLSPLPDGTQALFELSEAAGLQPSRFHGSEYNYPPDACMVVIEGGQMDMDISAIFGGMLDLNALRLWIEDGGTLLVAGDPVSSIVPDLLSELDLTGYDGGAPPDELVAVHSGPGGAGRLTPYTRVQNTGHVYELADARPALFDAVTSIEVGQLMSVEPAGTTVLLATRDSGDPVPVLLHARSGKGQVVWLTRPELLSNAWLAREDNHRLALALLSWAADGRALLFDEHIHGFTRAAPGTLAMLTRTTGGRLLLALAVLALLLFADSAVRAARVAPEAAPQRRQSTEMVLAQAELYRRAGARHVVADMQVDSLRRAYMQARHLAHPPPDAELLDWLQRWDGRGKAALVAYLHSRMLPRSSSALLALTQATDAAKAELARR